ncbi:MAG: hypothetical protein PHQ60_16465 [Sideroxydans sp.]|nr:hypothetical protein [Sideroxydans sp.]
MPSNAPKPAPWWKRYPDTNHHLPREPGHDDIADPRLSVGTQVRLCGKPDKARAILNVEWHRYRYRYVYVIETSGGYLPYWFADQLMLEGENQPVQELEQQRSQDSIWRRIFS